MNENDDKPPAPVQLEKEKNRTAPDTRTMTAWKIRARINDADGQPIAYQPPRTVPPDLGRKLTMKYPLDWDVVSRNVQVPYDPRVPRGGQMKPDLRQPTVGLGTSDGPGPGETRKFAGGKVNYK